MTELSVAHAPGNSGMRQSASRQGPDASFRDQLLAATPPLGRAGLASRVSEPCLGGAGQSAAGNCNEPGETCASALIQPPWLTNWQGPGGRLAHQACTRFASCARLSPPPGAWCSRSSCHACTSPQATCDQGKPSQAPKSSSASRASTRNCHPQRRSHRPTSRERCSGDTQMMDGSWWRRAACRMRCANRLALRGSTARSVRPMQRPRAPQAGG